MIYIASPYSHPDPKVRNFRFESALTYANMLMGMGHTCFSPIAYGHQFSLRFYRPTAFEAWIDFNDRILLACESMHILTIDGWEESRGIAHEQKLAEDHGIQVCHVAWNPYA